MPGLAGPGFSVFIVRHLGLIICKGGRIYFEALQREVCLPSVVHVIGIAVVSVQCRAMRK